MELKRLSLSGIPIIVEWYHDDEDIDMKEAGSDLAFLAEMDFTYISK
ncbi:MAG TPA: SiaC family regulatory phosphoprotein [Bacteroidales bacterium]|nr:SiaC family regulatory phosphoprotein [Bacteroidales bacterium]